MPKLVLTRALTFQHKRYYFRRGVVTEVDEGTYHDLLRMGGFADPDCAIDFINPLRLNGVPDRTTIPVIRDMGLGDVLMASIPLRDLARRYPRLRFVYAVAGRYRALFDGLPFLERAVGITDLKGGWSWGIDLRGHVERSRHQRRMDRIDIFSQYLLGGPPTSYDYPLRPTRERRRRGVERTGIDPDRPSVGVVVRASMGNRSWGRDHVARLCRIAAREGFVPVLLDGKPIRRDIWPALPDSLVDLTGRIDIAGLADVVASLDVVVSPDTGTLHLAEALDTRCVAYMTTVPPGLRIGHYRWTRCVYPEGKLQCLGCIHSPTCGLPDPKPCAQLSTPEAVWTEVEYMMGREPPWPVMANDGDGPCRFKGITAAAVEVA